MIIRNAKSSIAGLALAGGLLASGAADATVYAFDVNNPNGSTGAGDVTYFGAQYATGAEQLSLTSTIAENNGHLANGFWIVISDGPNPKSNYNEYAIFYGDGLTGDLTSYVYNGANSASSWNTPGEFIQTFSNAVSVDTSVAGEVTFDLTIDVSGINAYTPTTPGNNDWDGAQFGEKIGIWYHPVVFSGSGPTYNMDGTLASFSYDKQSWYDTKGKYTTAPEPAMGMLLALGLFGMVAARRRMK